MTDGLAFNGLQARFFSINAEVVHGCLTSRQFVSEQRLGNLGSIENAREQGQKTVGHA